MALRRGWNPSIPESSKMFKRIAAIGFIVVCTSIAWAILGSTILYRTNYSDEQLKSRVSSAWGTAQEQTPPTAAYQIVSQKQVTATENGAAAVRTVEHKTWVTPLLKQTRANAALRLDYRKKGLLWHSTYQVDFSGVYRFSNPSDQAHEVTFRMHLPASQAVYDDLNFPSTTYRRPRPVRKTMWWRRYCCNRARRWRCELLIARTDWTTEVTGLGMK